jgi:hypothetical protein
MPLDYPPRLNGVLPAGKDGHGKHLFKDLHVVCPHHSHLHPPSARCAPFLEGAPLPTLVRYRLSVALSGFVVYSRLLIL